MATTQTTQAAQTTLQTSSQFTRVMRIVYMVTLWGFIAGLDLQFFFAGLSIFVGVICQIKNTVCQEKCHAAKRLQRIASVP